MDSFPNNDYLCQQGAMVYPRLHNFMVTELEIKLITVLLFLMQLIQVITTDSQKRAIILIFSFFTPLMVLD